MARAPLANTGGVVHDCFDIAEGGYAVGTSTGRPGAPGADPLTGGVGIYTLSSVIGPPVGNALCGFFTQNVGEFNLFWFFVSDDVDGWCRLLKPLMG